MEKKILHLTLKKKWFDMILSGEKKEEYREYKYFWKRRLCVFPMRVPWNVFKECDLIIFRNGYSNNAPEIQIECKGIMLKTGNTEWGAEKGKEYFVLSLGEIINTKNIVPKTTSTDIN